MKSKSYVFEKFKEFRKLAEKQCYRVVKNLRSYNGGKYVCETFENYLSQNGFSLQILIPHAPQWNGVEERKNWTLLKMVHCLL